MDVRLTRDPRIVEYSSSKLNNGTDVRWKRSRSVKRKYDNVSLDAPRNIALGNADTWQGSCSSEVAQDRFPPKGNRQSNFRKAPVSPLSSFDEETVDDVCSEQFDDSEFILSVPRLCGPFSLSEDNHLTSSGATPQTKNEESDVVRSHSNEGEGRILFPKKSRALRNPVSEPQTSTGIRSPVQDIDIDREITQLRQALRSERKALKRLHVELEEERCASATAANEAVAMISRLQEEKAAIVMEAHQYRREAEEREDYNQEAICLLKDIVMSKEDDLLALQDQIEAYRTMYLRIESGGLGLANDQTNILERVVEESPLFLETQGTKSLASVIGSTYGKGPRYSQLDNSGMCSSHHSRDYESWNLELPVSMPGKWLNRLASPSARNNGPGGHSENAGCGYDENLVENRSFRNMDTGERILESSVNRKQSMNEILIWERQRFEGPEMLDLTSPGVQESSGTYRLEAETDLSSQEHGLEDATASILARVKRLEERFQDLGKPQACEGQGIDWSVKTAGTNTTVIGDADSLKAGNTSQDSEPEAFFNESKRFSQKVWQFTKSSSVGSELDCLENGVCSESLQRSTGEMGASTTIPALKTYRLDEHRAAPMQEDSCIGDEVDPVDGVHDVYEVKEAIVHHSERVVCDGVRKMSTLQESVRSSKEADPKVMERLPTMDSRHGALSDEREGLEPEVDKVSDERNSLAGHDTYQTMAEDGVHQLQVRLQALEGERVFMNQAIDSLRKENMELKVLQEIAQQLRELKGDVKKTGQLGKTLQEDQPTISSFFKGILSFTGLQTSADAEGNRFVWPFQKNLDTKVSKKNHDGLFHLLEEPQSQTSAFVTRGLKLRLPGSDERGGVSPRTLVHSSTI